MVEDEEELKNSEKTITILILNYDRRYQTIESKFYGANIKTDIYNDRLPPANNSVLSIFILAYIDHL